MSLYHPGSPWTEERIAELEALWRQGLSAGQIAREMGMGRNAVIGKLHRRGMTGEKQRSTKAPQTSVDANNKHDAKRRAPYVPMPRPNEPKSLDLTVLELRDATDTRPGTCKWPHGDGPFTFCGHPTVSGKPYCAFHAGLAYQPYVRGRGQTYYHRGAL